ncbi:MAG: DNA-binding response regulator [Chloroflexota bacterium]
MTGAIRVLIVDDHPALREGLRTILATQPDISVAGEAATGQEAVAQAIALCPDVVLMDLELPGLGGVEAIRRIRERLPGTRVVVFTAFDEDERVMSAVEAGAQGYLLKGASREEIFQALRAAFQGGTPLQPAVATALLRRLAAPTGIRERPAVLSPREREVLQLLAEGLTNKAIARRLVVSERTVKFHVGSILAKLEVPNRAAAVRVALERRLLADPPP